MWYNVMCMLALMMYHGIGDHGNRYDNIFIFILFVLFYYVPFTLIFSFCKLWCTHCIFSDFFFKQTIGHLGLCYLRVWKKNPFNLKYCNIYIIVLYVFIFYKWILNHSTTLMEIFFSSTSLAYPPINQKCFTTFCI